MNKGFEKLAKLSENKCLDKNAYIEVLKGMDMGQQPVMLGELDELTKNLAAMEDKDYIALKDHKDNAFVRLKFGEDYIYKDLWRRIKMSGIGHLSSFKTFENRFEIIIRIILGVRKNRDESDVEFEVRKKEFWDNLDYERGDGDFDHMIKDTPENKEKLELWLSYFIKYFYCEIKSKNSYIHEIKLYATDIERFNWQPKKEKAFDESCIERINHSAKEAIKSLSLLYQFKIGVSDDLKTSVMALVSTIYCNICKEVGYSCEFLEQYEKQKLLNDDKTKFIKENSEKVGSLLTSKEVFDASKRLFDKFKNKLFEDCFLTGDDVYFRNGAIIFEMSFSNSFLYHTAVKEDVKRKFDDYVLYKDDYRYIVDAAYLKEIKEILKNEYAFNNIEFKVQDGQYGLEIYKIKGIVSDLVRLTDILA